MQTATDMRHMQNACMMDDADDGAGDGRTLRQRTRIESNLWEDICYNDAS